jgi:hypothetical protein
MIKYTTFVYAHVDNAISDNADYVGIHRTTKISIDAIDEIRAYTLLNIYVKDMSKWIPIDPYKEI